MTARWMATLAGGALALVWVLAQTATAFEISSDQQMDGASPKIVGAGAGNTVTPSGTAPNLTYNWADRDGDGSSNAVAAAGLTLGAYKLYCADTTARSRGTLTFHLHGGAMTGGDGLAIVTYRGNQRQSDNVTIANVAAIAMGGLDTHAYLSSSASEFYDAGNVVIGSAAVPAGPIRIATIDARTTGQNKGSPGSVTIYGAGAVLIEDSLGQAGGLLSNSYTQANKDVKVTHAGHFRANSVTTYIDSNWAGGTIRVGRIALDGGDSSGDLTVGAFDASYKSGRYGSTTRENKIDLRNYNNVTIGNLYAYTLHGATYPADGLAGDADITVGIAGDITVTGAIDLSHYTNARAGDLKLAAGGKVTLAALDLGRVRRAQISSGRGLTAIDGALSDFNTAYSAGSGTMQDPYLTTQTKLRAPADQRIHYKTRGGLNADLDGRVYRVANLAGTAGQGAILMPEPVRGTVVVYF